MLTMRTNAMNSTTQQLSTATLLDLLQDPRDASIGEIAGYFAVVHRLIESLPLASAEYCFAHNWLTSAQELWETGDYATARYQVGLVAKKLKLTEELCETPRSTPLHGART
jgi:hypothetical protein